MKKIRRFVGIASSVAMTIDGYFLGWVLESATRFRHCECSVSPWDSAKRSNTINSLVVKDIAIASFVAMMVDAYLFVFEVLRTLTILLSI